MYACALIHLIGQIWVTDRESVDYRESGGDRCHAYRTEGRYRDDL